MAIYRCKMCGGDLELQEGKSIVTCEFCGTEQTIPTVKDENLQALFNRANTLRMKCEFDKSEAIYEKILQANDKEAEAYWGVILCKYGIEYVEEPTTFKRVPTCHRTSYDAIMADDDYKSAILYADVVQKSLYEMEARVIDAIQKDILAISQKEEPYDVFICYKESDDTGKRTVDSVIANDIYYQLTQEGFKVFYAAITLEDKLGSQYEPYIFSAINSAKVMLVIGTKPEFFNAVWVKNEWSRFLKVIKKDKTKLLIPCYRDMDAYELPDEFAHLQAQDMSKIGFINDIVRGIKKVCQKESNNTSTRMVANANENTHINQPVEPLLKRLFMFLEDGEWNKANEFSEQALNRDPENALAYAGKLMAEFQIRDMESLAEGKGEFSDSNAYKKILRFADEELKSKFILANQKREEVKKEEIYVKAKKLMNSFKSEIVLDAASMFRSISGWKDSSELVEQCYVLAEEKRKEAVYNDALYKANVGTIEKLETSVELLEQVKDFKDATLKQEEFIRQLEELKKQKKKQERRKKIKEGLVKYRLLIFLGWAVLTAMIAIINIWVLNKWIVFSLISVVIISCICAFLDD